MIFRSRVLIPLKEQCKRKTIQKYNKKGTKKFFLLSTEKLPYKRRTLSSFFIKNDNNFNNLAKVKQKKSKLVVIAEDTLKGKKLFGTFH